MFGYTLLGRSSARLGSASAVLRKRNSPRPWIPIRHPTPSLPPSRTLSSTVIALTPALRHSLRCNATCRSLPENTVARRLESLSGSTSQLPQLPLHVNNGLLLQEVRPPVAVCVHTVLPPGVCC